MDLEQKLKEAEEKNEELTKKLEDVASVIKENEELKAKVEELSKTIEEIKEALGKKEERTPCRVLGILCIRSKRLFKFVFMSFKEDFVYCVNKLFVVTNNRCRNYFISKYRHRIHRR